MKSVVVSTVRGKVTLLISLMGELFVYLCLLVGYCFIHINKHQHFTQLLNQIFFPYFSLFVYVLFSLNFYIFFVIFHPNLEDVFCFLFFICFLIDYSFNFSDQSKSHSLFFHFFIHSHSLLFKIFFFLCFFPNS